MNAAELRGVSYIYSENTPFRKVAVNHIDIAFEEKIITGIIGHTGSGKSTVSQLLNGLLKPSEGTVEVEGRNIWAEPKKIKEVRFTVGLVFQYPEYQLFAQTVEKDVGFGLKYLSLIHI